jgi:hypothetical protein
MNFTPANDADDAFSNTSQIVAPLTIGEGTDREGDILLRVYTREWTVEPEEHAELRAAYSVLVEGPAGRSELLKPLPPVLVDERVPHLVQVWPLVQEASGVVSFVEFIVKAFAYTGRTITVEGVEHDGVVPTGSYGYMVHHEGGVEEWDLHIQGAEKIGKNSYLVRVPLGTATDVTDYVDALEPARWAVVVAGGVAFPGLTNPGAYRVGPSVTLEGARLGEGPWSLHAQLGYAYMAPAGATSGPWHEVRLASYLQRRFEVFPWMLPFLTLGGGLLLNEDGDISAGAAIAGGIDFRLNRALDIRFGIDFIGNVNHSNVHAGVGTVFRLVESRLKR